MTLTDQFNAFCKASRGKLGAAERGLYITLLDIWNRLRRPEWFDVSNTELQAILATGSHNSITRWRKALEKESFIEAKSLGRGKPLRFHITELATTSENDVPTSKSDVPTTAKNAIPNEATTSENDVLPRQKVTSTTSKSDVGVRQKMTTSQSTEIYTEITEGGKIQSSNLESIAPPEKIPPALPDEILTAFQNKLRPLRGDEAKDLAVLTEEYGTRRILKAIDKAQARGKRELNYLKGILRSWREDDDEGDTYGQRHQAYNRRYCEKIDPQAERDKWRDETSGWD